jgi:hypothetical protein
MFITATYIYNPINPHATSQKNYSSNKSNMIVDEIISITKNIRNSDLKKCNVIIDIFNENVIKCRDFMMDGKIVSNPDYIVLLNYFKQQHPRQIEPLLTAMNTVIAEVIDDSKNHNS